MAGTSGTEEEDGYLYSDDLYVNLPEEKFSCPICLCPVQQEAHLTGCCGKHFCFRCISRVKNGNKPCPMCNATPVAIFPNKERQREINQVEVHCPVSAIAEGARDCDWKGELGSAKHHVVEKHGTGALRRLSGTEENQETQLAANMSHQCQVVDLEEDARTCHVSARIISVHSTAFPPVPVSTSAPHTPSHPTTPPHTPPTEEPQPRHPYLPHHPFPAHFHRFHPHSPPPHHPHHPHPPPPHHPYPPPPHPPHPHPPPPHPPHHFPHRPHFHHPSHGHHFPHRAPHHHHPHPHHHHHPHFPHRPPHHHPHPPHHCRPRHPFP